MKFHAEVIQVQARKLASLDKQYKVVLVSEDEAVLQLSKYINESVVEITISDSEGSREV